MFGGKPFGTPFGAKSFGTPFAASTSTFGSSTPFGGNTSTFTAKTTGTSAGFGTPGFGSNTPHPTGGLFGQNTNSSTATGLFGGVQQTTTYGGGQNTSIVEEQRTTGTSAGFGTSGFGSNTPAPTGGLFAQNTSSSTATGLFGGVQQTTTFGGGQNTSFAFGSTPSASVGLFGQNNQSTGAGLFATPVSNTAFGAKTPGFSGFAATGNAASTGSSLFGSESSGTSLFGQPSGSIGYTPTDTSGTAVKLIPPIGQDTIVKNGVTTNIDTKHQCITAMKEYENKSIEELRLEDYAANRKGKQQQAGGSLFGTTPATQSTGFNFGGASSSSGFGASVGFGTSTGTSLFGKQQSTGLFGQQNKTAFGTTMSANTGLGFGTNTSTGTSLFGQQQKPGGLFGANPVTTQSSLFGAGTSFGSTSTFQPTAFGTSQQQSLPAFGTSTTGSSGFIFNTGRQGSSNVFAKPLTNSTFSSFNTTPMSTGGVGFVPSGTLIKFSPPSGQDTIVEDGVTTDINTKLQCITAMTAYENKSTEELRLEDYAANRKGKHQRVNDILFGKTPATQAAGFNFGGASSGTGFGTSGSCFGPKYTRRIIKRQKKWKCDVCHTKNKGEAKKCIACESAMPTMSSDTTTTEFKPKCMDAGSQTDFEESTVAEIKPKCMDAGSQTDFGESTVAEMKPKCMVAGSQTDFGESTAAEIKPKCIDAESQTDIGDFASTLVIGGLTTATSGVSIVSTSIGLATATLASGLTTTAKLNELLPSVRSSSSTGATSGELPTATIPVILPTTATTIPTCEPPVDIVSENNTSDSETETITVTLNALEISSSTL